MNDKLKNKKLLILGGDMLSKDIVKCAQRNGMYVYVTDWYPLEQSPAKQIADQACYVSTTDIPALLVLIKKEHIDGIITGYTDSVLIHYATLCEAVNLPCYGTVEQFMLFTNKNEYKKLCREFGVPTIPEYKITDPFSKEQLSNLQYPVLVKPADNSGSRGVSICSNNSQFIQAYNTALDFSNNKEILVERYLDAKEATVFFFFQDGEIHLTGIGNRHVKKNQGKETPLPVAYTFPSKYTLTYEAKIFPNVERMLKHVGVKNGMMFMQCLLDNDMLMVYDIGYRLTGSLEYRLIDCMQGYNPLELLIEHAVCGKVTVNTDKICPKWDKYGFNISFSIRQGQIAKINGIEKIKQLPYVIDAVIAHSENEIIPQSSIGTLDQIILRVFGCATTKKELSKYMIEIRNQVEVYDEDNNEMLLPLYDNYELLNEYMSDLV